VGDGDEEGVEVGLGLGVGLEEGDGVKRVS